MKRPDLIYLGDLLDDQKDSLYVGISHLKPEGNQIVADHLFEILQKAESATPKSSRAKSSSAPMSEKMKERNRVIIVNVSIVAGLVWSYFKGYSPQIILGCGVFLLAFANLLMYLKRRRV